MFSHRDLPLVLVPLAGIAPGILPPAPPARLSPWVLPLMITMVSLSLLSLGPPSLGRQIGSDPAVVLASPWPAQRGQ